ncbi:hypothetical protein F5878DRAFT_542673, partial [Lentinula raphanica]
MPVNISKQLYTALVDCHLTNGCEIVIDRDSKLVGLLEDVQIRFLRRMLGVSSNSVISPLFTETGILPIRARCLILALRYLKYLASLPPSHYAAIALSQNILLLDSHCACWLSDIQQAL